MTDKGSIARVVQLAFSARDPKGLAAFYQAVFGWESASFREDGSEVFVVEGLVGDQDLRARIERSISGAEGAGLECTVAVASVDKIMALVLANGGRVIQATPFIEGVGGIVRFADPEGNVVTAMQF